MVIILKRLSKERKSQIHQNGEQPKAEQTRTTAHSSTMKLSGADIREAYGLP